MIRSLRKTGANSYAVVLRNLPWQPFACFDIPNLDVGGVRR
jgi:hypothetical protein